jgi:type II secretory pathway component PulF
MPTFSYVGRDERGGRVKGLMEALDAGALAERLGRMGTTLIRVEERKDSSAVHSIPIFTRGVSVRDRIGVYLQLGTMLRAGIPLTTSLDDLQKEADNPRLRAALADAKRRIEQGEAFSAGCRAHPALFPSIACELVEAGESSGRLDETFQALARYADREEEISSQVKAALRYPALVLCAAVAVVGVTFVYVMPNFARVFGRMHVELPLLTRAMLATAAWTRDHGLLLLGSLGLLAGILAWLARREPVAARIDALRLRLPVLGPLQRKMALARFARTLSMLVRGGIPILQGLAIAGRVTGNRRLRAVIDDAAQEVQRGKGLAEPLGASGEFPAAVVRMISVGERTGKLDELLHEVGEHYDLEIPYVVKRITTQLEVVMILAMGALVALIAFAFMMPMAKMLDLV